MNKKHITALLLSVSIILPIFNITVSAQELTEVYTECTKGNFNHSGDGSISSPFNLFEDALEAVADGGTIYVLGEGGFINAMENNSSPFPITKNVTIAAAPDLGFRPEISVRRMGMILGADVTFKNIILGFASGYRPVICANGYSLTIDNASYGKGTRIIHLAGGGMNGYFDVTAGERSRITVKGSESLFGNIYAGSINGAFDKAVEITVENVSGRNIGDIYACGAAPGYYNGDNFLDPDNEPLFPEANAETFPVNGEVSVTLNKTGLKAVYGDTGGNKNASVSVYAPEFLSSCALNNISALEVRSGAFMPDWLNDGADVSVYDGASLNISGENIGDLTVNNFAGGGTLIMAYDQLLTVNGEVSGQTEFKINGSNTTSYFAQPEHLYIKTSKGDGVFTFEPYFSQRGMTFDKYDDGWRTSAQPPAPDSVLTRLDIGQEVFFINKSDINGDIPLDIEVDAEYSESTMIEDIGLIPMEFTVAHNGNTYLADASAIEGFEDYYEYNIHELNINFQPIGNVITLSNYNGAYERLGDIEAGIYDIEITAPVGDESVTHSLRVVILEDDEETGDFIVTDTHGRIYATYINSGDAIDQAVVIACAYEDGNLKLADIAGEKLSVKNGQLQSFRFDMSSVLYDTIKIFVWDSEMTPLRDNYKS